VKGFKQNLRDEAYVVRGHSDVTNLERPSKATTTRNRWLGLGLGTAGFVVFFFWTYLFGLHVHWGNADLLRGLLQGSDMAHGNVLLNHWFSGSDSYWAVDSYLFALGVLAFGTKIVVAHYVAAFVWAGVIVVAATVATTGLRRGQYWAAVATVVITLGLPSGLFASFLSASMTHIATALVVLLAFLGLSQGRFGWGWCAAVTMLAAGLLSDPLIVAYGIVPTLIVGVFDSIRSRKWLTGLSTASASVASIVLAVVVRTIADHLGTYQIVPGTSSAPLIQMLHNVRALLPDSLALLGLGRRFSASHVPWELELFRVFGALTIAAGLAVGLACLLLNLISGQPRVNVQGMAARSEASFRLNDLLVLGTVGVVVTYVALRADAGGLRYLPVGVVFASILGAMLVGQMVGLLALSRLKYLTAGLAMILLGNAACAGFFLSRPSPVSPFPLLSNFLVSHHLERGVGDYWSSAPITAYSSGKVTVRQVVPSSQGGISPYLVLAKSTWYFGKFQFLVYDVSTLTGRLIREAPGFPFADVDRTYREGPFRIVVWRHATSMAALARGGP